MEKILFLKTKYFDTWKLSGPNFRISVHLILPLLTLPNLILPLFAFDEKGPDSARRSNYEEMDDQDNSEERKEWRRTTQDNILLLSREMVGQEENIWTRIKKETINEMEEEDDETKRDCFNYFVYLHKINVAVILANILPHSAPSWILS